MTYRIITLTCTLLYACLASMAQGENEQQLFQQLDDAIAHSATYQQKKETEIATLKQMRAKSDTEIAYKLYEEYKSYRSDSALHYLSQCIHIAEKNGQKGLQAHYQSLLALQYSVMGLFTESITTLQKINPHDLSAENKGDYYVAYNHVYGELGFANKDIDKDLSQSYYKKADAYRDSIFATFPPDSEIYLQKQETLFTSQQKYKQALTINDKRMALCLPGSHEYGIVAYYRFLIYRNLGKKAKARQWLIRSAICDVKNAVTDQASLWNLAALLGQEGDLERAYRYINYSWDSAKTFGTQIRSWQISPILSNIDSKYQHLQQQTNRRLLIFFIIVSIMAIALAALTIYINKQKTFVTSARNQLKDINTQLEHLNHELSAANEKLKTSNNKLYESNSLKEEYIGQFFGACSLYIDKMDKLRKDVNKLVKNREYADLYDMTKSTEMKERELEELYTNFDRVFLHLFPNFVDNLNELLKPDSQIKLTDPNKLTAIIRVFALIRLGIDDSVKIAEFLHYALNTIYNYRAKLRNAALGNRQDFEKKVRELGRIDKQRSE